MAVSIQPQNLLLGNFYLVLYFQLFTNWQTGNCNNSVSLWKFIFLFILTLRLILNQAYCNNILSSKTSVLANFITSIILSILGIYMAIVLSDNSSDFDDGVCSSCRIEYVFEITICFMTLGKDVIYSVFGKQLISQKN